MLRISVNDLQQLDAGLDLFEESPPVDLRLLSQELYPPLPICGNTLIWGFHLLRAAADRNRETMNCQRAENLSAGAMLDLALRLENRGGKYSWAEKEALWRYLQQKLVADSAPQVLLIEGRQDTLWSERIETYTGFPQTLKTLLTTGKVDYKTARLVDSLPPTVIQMAGAAALSFSQRRSLLADLTEIARKQNWNPETIQSTLEQALEQEDPVQAIQRRRYPELSAMEQRFDKIQSELTRGTGILLTPPPYFEGDSYQIHFSFNSGKVLSRRIEVLKRLQTHGQELYKLLF